MKPRPIAAVWISSAFCTALALAGLVLAALGAGERGTDVALQVTARLSFLLFWPAYAGGAMTALLGPAFQPLKQYARDFGLAFASALLVHLGLVAWLCYIGAAPGLTTFIFFGIAALWACLLTLFSVGRLQHRLRPKGWWLLRTIGLNYIAFAFALDFFSQPLLGSIKHSLLYIPFAVLSVFGPTLRLAAYVQRVAQAPAYPSASE
ncbi:MAG: hypothetical protein WCD20_10380 [Rhodomicrobium sp.]